MVKRLDETDRGILTFRPNIAFIEPDQEEGVIEGVDTPRLEDVQADRDRIRSLANAVNVMAAAIQARADQRADMVVLLDPVADQETIQAMRRKFPDADPNQITYDQYRQVRGDIRNKGIELGAQPLVTPAEVELARNELNTYVPGRYNTAEARTGGLRPELDNKAQIIAPVNIEEMQINLICILVNFIWKNFIKKIIVNAAGIPVGLAFKALPDQICDPGSPIAIPGLFILGDPLDDLLTGAVAQTAAEEAGI